MRHLCRFVVCHVLLAAALCLLLRPACALSESDQDKAIAALQASVKSLQASVSTLQAQNAGLQSTVSSQAVTIHTQQSILAFFSKKTDPTRADGKKGTELFLTGANLHIVNGLGATNGEPGNRTDTAYAVVNGLGNLIIGYNSLQGDGNAQDIRTGSHNLVVGDQNGYSSFGTIVAGFFNVVSGPFACAVGGQNNKAEGTNAAVYGGIGNVASADFSCINGGSGNTANGRASTLTGGLNNTAFGDWSSSIGGQTNIVSGFNSLASGGFDNTVSGRQASVVGGTQNAAVGDYSVVTGGSGVEQSHAGGFAAGGVYIGDTPGPGVFHSP